jgi:hypothetical protein
MIFYCADAAMNWFDSDAVYTLTSASTHSLPSTHQVDVTFQLPCVAAGAIYRRARGRPWINRVECRVLRRAKSCVNPGIFGGSPESCAKSRPGWPSGLDLNLRAPPWWPSSWGCQVQLEPLEQNKRQIRTKRIAVAGAVEGRTSSQPDHVVTDCRSWSGYDGVGGHAQNAIVHQHPPPRSHLDFPMILSSWRRRFGSFISTWVGRSELWAQVSESALV